MFFEKLLGIVPAIAETTAASGTAGTAQEVNPTGSLISTGLMFVVMIAVFYFMLMRPQKKKDKQVKDMLAALKPGDRVTTIGGIYGTIKSIKDETITLYVGTERMEMVVARWAIRGVENISVENDGEELT